jgi:hypothetical protein
MFRDLLNLFREPRQVTAQSPEFPESVRRLSHPLRFLLGCTFQDLNDPQCLAAADDICGFFKTHYHALPPPSAAERSTLRWERQFYAAGLLACGDLEMANTILATLPHSRPAGKTGWCVVAGSTVISEVLPLPPALRSDGRTHVDRDAVQEWLDKHRPRLQWDTAVQRFTLKDEA